jgi:hypothetical protein
MMTEMSSSHQRGTILLAEIIAELIDEATGLELSASHALEFVPDGYKVTPPVTLTVDAAVKLGYALGLRSAAERLGGGNG